MSNADKRNEDEFAERARRLFAESVDGLDGATRSRLARARADAVEAARGRRSWPAPSRLVPIGGLAALALALALLVRLPGGDVEPVEEAMLSDLDILLEGEELELFEDLEFYAWLLEQPELLEPEDVDTSG